MPTYSVHVSPAAMQDMADLYPRAPGAVARIAAVMQQLEADQDLLDRLTQHGYTNDDPHFNVEVFAEQMDQGRNLWRLKVWSDQDELIAFRVIYAFDPVRYQYHVLGVANRRDAYDASSEKVRRIVEEFDSLDIRRH